MAEVVAAPVARTWTAAHEVYVEGVLHSAGTRFTTAAPPGAAWVSAEDVSRSRTAR